MTGNHLSETMRARMRAKQFSPGSAHPDENELAAFSENTVGAGERAAMLEHLAGCSDCRDLVYLSAARRGAAVSGLRYLAASATAAAVACLVFFAPEIASSFSEKDAVTAAVAVKQVRVSFIPPPVHPEQRKMPVLAEAPPLLAPELPTVAPLPVELAAKPQKPLPVVVRSVPDPYVQTSFLPARVQATAVRMSNQSSQAWRISEDKNGVERSADQGLTWERVAIPGLTGNIRRIDTKFGSRVSVQTTSGEHWATTDSGRHWTRTL